MFFRFSTLLSQDEKNKKKVMKILLPILILICAAEVFAQPQTKCFRNDGLRDNYIVRFEADGSDVAGSYFVESDGNAEQTQTFDFSATRSGNALTADQKSGIDTFQSGKLAVIRRLSVRHQPCRRTGRLRDDF